MRLWTLSYENISEHQFFIAQFKKKLEKCSRRTNRSQYFRAALKSQMHRAEKMQARRIEMQFRLRRHQLPKKKSTRTFHTRNCINGEYLESAVGKVTVRKYCILLFRATRFFRPTARSPINLHIKTGEKQFSANPIATHRPYRGDGGGCVIS